MWFNVTLKWIRVKPRRKLNTRMRFNPADPFPLSLSAIETYQDLQMHSCEADRWLGLNIEKIEADLQASGCRLRAQQASGEHQQLWIGLAPKSLLTPYVEIRRTLEALQLPKGSVIADLGAAYGRMGFVIGRYFPELKFIGYEYVGERVREFRRCASRFGFKNIEMHHVDLCSPQFKIDEADVYFIYDYGTPKAISKTLHDLRRISASREIHVIVRGNACHQIVETNHSWLSRKVDAPSGLKSSVFHSKNLEQDLFLSL